jgi:hypothetical protein
MEFLHGIKESIKGLTADVDGLSYIPWATAIAKAGRPEQRVALSLGYMRIFGGAVVAIEQPVGDDRWQRTWLPVLDTKNRPVPVDALKARDLGDAINRCRAKSVAMVNGVALSLYAGYGEDNGKLLKDLGVRPDSDLTAVEPLTSQKAGKTAASYVDWAAALAAARITDPNFHWEVEMFDGVSPEGEIHREPYLALPHGYMVAVSVTYKAKRHTEYLPIMGVVEVSTKNGPRKMDHQTLEAPNAFDWNRSILRDLTKAIAVVSGYGLSVYAGEDIEVLQSRPIGGKTKDAATPPAATPAQQEAQPPAASEASEARTAMVEAVRQALLQSNRQQGALMTWLGQPADTLIEALSDELLEKAHKALSRKVA